MLKDQVHHTADLVHSRVLKVLHSLAGFQPLHDLQWLNLQRRTISPARNQSIVQDLKVAFNGGVGNETMARHALTARNAALGVRVHSGWAVVVCISGDHAALEQVDRRRIVMTQPTMKGAKQPYHHVEKFKIADAEHHLSQCAASSENLAIKTIREILRVLNTRNFGAVGAAILAASGRNLPSLPVILASHALIHAAEGEFFRSIVRIACESCQIPVVTFRDHELVERTKEVFGKAADGVMERISNLRNVVGSPWTQDEKTATLAALMLLTTQTLARHG